MELVQDVSIVSIHDTIKYSRKNLQNHQQNMKIFIFIRITKEKYKPLINWKQYFHHPSREQRICIYTYYTDLLACSQSLRCLWWVHFTLPAQLVYKVNDCIHEWIGEYKYNHSNNRPFNSVFSFFYLLIISNRTRHISTTHN